MSDRAAFEKWARDRPLDLARQGQTYRFHYTILAWDAWQAACVACADACEEERVDAVATGLREDYVYNSATEHCAAACRELAK